MIDQDRKIFDRSGSISGSVIRKCERKNAPDTWWKERFIISLSGIIGGAWMPLETMGNFEVVAECLHFYPSVYLGRVITKATHLLPDDAGNIVYYSFSDRGILFLMITFAYLISLGALTVIFFNKRLKNDC